VGELAELGRVHTVVDENAYQWGESGVALFNRHRVASDPEGWRYVLVKLDDGTKLDVASHKLAPGRMFEPGALDNPPDRLTGDLFLGGNIDRPTPAAVKAALKGLRNEDRIILADLPDGAFYHGGMPGLFWDLGTPKAGKEDHPRWRRFTRRGPGQLVSSDVDGDALTELGLEVRGELRRRRERKHRNWQRRVGGWSAERETRAAERATSSRPRAELTRGDQAELFGASSAPAAVVPDDLSGLRVHPDPDVRRAADLAFAARYPNAGRRPPASSGTNLRGVSAQAVAASRRSLEAPAVRKRQARLVDEHRAMGGDTRKVVILPCSATKLGHADWAGDIYTGPIWQSWRAGRAGRPLPAGWRLRILSAEHGLLDPADWVEPYDHKLTAAEVPELAERIAAAWNRRGVGHLYEAIAVGGELYQAAIAESGIPVLTVIDGRSRDGGPAGIGVLRSRVRELAERIGGGDGPDLGR
jgi:hypothetical protein